MLDWAYMAQSFYFYDTETTGTRASTSRIMQFAGQRTNLNLEPIGDPDDLLIRITPDVLPEPDAVLIHGITPQKTLQDGITEAEFARIFYENIALADTIFVGFNSVRFDDEFVRYLLYRNFYEPYEWQWKDGRSRWDILDALRMMRALRPEGVEWPFESDGKPTVRLERMTQANSLAHDNAHTALADVMATISVAKLMRSAQPKLFEYLLSVRSKHEIKKIVEQGQPFVYTSGKYANENLKTTVVCGLIPHPKRDAMVVYDLRYDPEPFLTLSETELSDLWQAKYEKDKLRLPVKTLQYNRCPAIAPLSVLDQASLERITLDMSLIKQNLKKLLSATEFIDKLSRALGILVDKQESLQLESIEVDSQLYNGFWNERDKHDLRLVRSHAPATLGELGPKLQSKRLQKLLPLYKARNYPEFLTPEEYDSFESYRHHKLVASGDESSYARFMRRMQELTVQRQDVSSQFLLTELQLYAESILPLTDY